MKDTVTMAVTQTTVTLVEVPEELSPAMRTDVATRMVGRGEGTKGQVSCHTNEFMDLMPPAYQVKPKLKGE